WRLPLVESDQVKVKVEAVDYLGHIGSAETSGQITISYPEVGTLVNPIAGQIVEAGATAEVKWYAGEGQIDSSIYKVNLSYLVTGEGQTWQPLARGEENDGSYILQIPDVDTVLVNLKLELIGDDEGIAATDQSGWFTIDGPPTVKLFSPNGGQKLTAGQYFNITWEAADGSGLFYYSLYYSVDGGSTYLSILQDYLVDYSYNNQIAFSRYWTIPAVNTTEAKIKVKVRDISGNIVSDESDAVFAIRMPALGEVISPNGGETFYTNSSSSIRWQASVGGASASAVGATITANLYYQIADGTWEVIANNQSNSGYYYYWVPPAEAISDKVKVKVELKQGGETISSDESDAYFSVAEYSYGSTITITAPTSGEALQAGATYRIKWETADQAAEDALAGIYLTYQSSGVLFSALITQETSLKAGYYDWKIPAIATTSATIGMSSYNTSDYFTGSSKGFFITAPPPETIIITKEVEPVSRLEDGRGNKITLFDGALPPDTVVRISTTETPAKLFKGSSLASDIVEITASGATLAKPILITLKLKDEIANPRPFYYDPVGNRWKNSGLEVVEQGSDSLTFSTSHLSIFAVFDVLDSTAPLVRQILIDGLVVKDGALITSQPRFIVEVDDDFGIDKDSVRLIVDEIDVLTVAEGITRALAPGASESYVLSVPNKLGVGNHTFKFVAADEAGNSADYQVTLRVMGDELAEVYVYPNPFTLGDSLGIDFAGTSINQNQGALRIYDIAGQLVFSTTFNQPASVNWNARNNAGNPVAAGIYIYLVTTDSGGKKVGKIAIIN
ncbi:MAG: T9SS type A sorting domain-containing protein, partial [bacterium]